MRTIEQFVSEARDRHRTREELRGIAQCSRWAAQIQEVLVEFDRQENTEKKAPAAA